jgi:hypothetical protein
VTAVIVIPRRFCGPPDRGNGGVTAGLLAEHVGRQVEVTLRRPSPLDTPLSVDVDGTNAKLRDGDALIAEAAATTVDVAPPAPVPVDVARQVSTRSPVVLHPEWHPFPTCFVCGPGRAGGDGLRVLPGRVDGTDTFAAPVEFPRDLAAEDGTVPAHLLWAALDCPSSFVMYLDGVRPATPYVLGRIAARVDRTPGIERPLVARSWPIGHDGRKLFSASALYDAEEVVAVARATWISV